MRLLWSSTCNRLRAWCALSCSVWLLKSCKGADLQEVMMSQGVRVVNGLADARASRPRYGTTPQQRV